MTPFRETLRGILAMTAANLAFLLNDTQVKLAGDDLPMGEIMFLRGLVASAVIAAVVFGFGLQRHLRALLHGTILLRVVGEVGATLLFLTALFRMPIADITAVLQVVPLMTTAAGAFFLRETVGWRRWTAVLIGFVGVLVVLRPGGEGFNLFGFVALAAMFFVTMRDMMTRIMPPGLPTMLVAGLTSVSVTATGAVLGVGEQWVMPDGRPLLLCAGAGLFIAAGYWLAIVAMRHGEISVVAPFRYSAIPWAIIVGFLVWGDVPDVPMLIGCATIILAGLYTFHRERRHAPPVAGAEL